MFIINATENVISNTTISGIISIIIISIVVLLGNLLLLGILLGLLSKGLRLSKSPATSGGSFTG